MNTTAAPSSTPICDQLRATGAWNPNWEPFYQLDPAWAEKFMAAGVSPMLAGVLDKKTVEFIAIAVDASCTQLALDLGATKEEIAAVLQLTSVVGIHTMSLGAPILLEELAAREVVT